MNDSIWVMCASITSILLASVAVIYYFRKSDDLNYKIANALHFAFVLTAIVFVVIFARKDFTITQVRGTIMHLSPGNYNMLSIIQKTQDEKGEDDR